MMMKMIKNKDFLIFIKIFIFLDLALIIYSFYFKNIIWLINTQVAFISFLFISIASFISYRKNIKKRVENLDLLRSENEDVDMIDKIEDPYDLYSDIIESNKDDLNAQEIKEIIKEEKAKVKAQTFKNTIFSASSYLSLYRLFGYAFLIFGFFILNNNKIFIPVAFIVGLSIVPFGVLLSKFFRK